MNTNCIFDLMEAFQLFWIFFLYLLKTSINMTMSEHIYTLRKLLAEELWFSEVFLTSCLSQTGWQLSLTSFWCKPTCLLFQLQRAYCIYELDHWSFLLREEHRVLYLNLFLRVCNFLEDISVRERLLMLSQIFLNWDFWPCMPVFWVRTVKVF